MNSASASIYNHPEYREAVSRERFIRACAFLPINERICGVEVIPLNLDAFLRLTVATSPFLYDGITAEQLLKLSRPVLRWHIRNFFWLTHPQWQPDSIWHKWCSHIRAANLDIPTAVASILEYIEEVFGKSAQNKSANQKSYYSFYASMVNTFAMRYGWTAEYVGSKPLKQLFQLKNIFAKMNGESINNPSDAIRARLRAEKNAEEMKARANGN